MTTSTLAYTGTLVLEACPDCGISHAIPNSLNDHALRDHRVSVFCPLGHEWHYIGETEAETERRMRKSAEDGAAAARARADQAEASLRTTKGHVTRLRKRVAAGECPYCGQHLRDLQRHVARQHAAEVAEAIAEPEPAA